MTLALTLVLSSVAFAALLWGVSLVLQGYLYSQPAERLPLRSVAGGLAVGCFLAFWAFVNTRAGHKDKYGTLFEFTPTAVREVTEFEAVRQLAVKDEKGQPKEATTPFRWQTEGRAGRFVDPATNKDFKLNDPTFMTRALVVADPDGKKARFDAVLKDGRYATQDDERRFVEAGGSRYVDGRDPRRMVVPSPAAFLQAVLLNVGHFVLWFVVFWLVLRFGIGHAVGLAGAFGLATMLALMPLLFRLNEVPGR